MSAPRLQIRALEKAFGANLVLRRLDFALAPAEVHALVGGNGAGKSTLSKIIAGIERQDAGRLELDEQPYVPADRRAAQAAGVVMVLQELSVLPTLTVAENLFLGSLPARFGGVIDRAALHSRARAALTRVGLGELASSTTVRSSSTPFSPLLHMLGEWRHYSPISGVFLCIDSIAVIEDFRFIPHNPSHLNLLALEVAGVSEVIGNARLQVVRGGEDPISERHHGHRGPERERQK